MSASRAESCPHCAGREIIGWGRSHGSFAVPLQELRAHVQRPCGPSRPWRNLRKKEKWLDHARAMIEGKSLAKTAELCGVHPTTAFRWRHQFLRAPASDKPRMLRGIAEADETFVSSNPSKWPMVRPAAKRRGKRGGNGQTSGPSPGQYSRSRGPRPERARPSNAVPPQVDSASVETALAGVVTPSNHLIGDGGRAIAAFARKAGIPFLRRAPSHRESRPPRRCTCTSIPSTPTTAVSSNG